jgi:hypoxanthine phosphoribosyltransferase
VIRRITWDEFEDDVGRLAEKLASKGIRSVRGIARGGLVVAVKLSHIMNVPYSENADTVVDDILETGKTISRFTDMRCICLYDKPGKRDERYEMPKDLTIGVALMSNAWYVFPWEDRSRAQEDYENYTRSRA